MNYANQQTSTAQRLGTALLSIAVTVVMSGSIIFGMAGGFDKVQPAEQMAAAHGQVPKVAQR